MFYSMVGICKITQWQHRSINRSCGNTRCFDQNYQPDKITLQVSVLLDKVTCAVFLAFEKRYGCVVKGLAI